MNFNIQDTINADDFNHSEDSNLWLYIELIKPGKHTFCVSHQDKLYVHKFLCQSRTEEIPKGKQINFINFFVS